METLDSGTGRKLVTVRHPKHRPEAWEGELGGLSALHDPLKTTLDVQLLRASPGRSQRLRPALGLCHERWETSF
jgi:hypothetical protein